MKKNQKSLEIDELKTVLKELKNELETISKNILTDLQNFSKGDKISQVKTEFSMKE